MYLCLTSAVIERLRTLQLTQLIFSVLLERDTDIDEEQFWWVMNEWGLRGEGFLKAIWKTQIIDEESLCEDDWSWAQKFRPADDEHTVEQGRSSESAGQ